jgi:hypothetical protein
MSRKEKILSLFELRKKVFVDKSSDYGEAYIKSGELLEKIFPNGIILKDWRDHCSYQLITRKMDKLLRYTNLRFSKNKKDIKVKESIGDTLGDDAVYSLMLEALEEETDNDKNR